ncbi:hypothetical protein BDZ89DRAFT_609338 [Hymenopellis radicata]|nr:hypothetical protein BDZ89DRAFT_609338 [Hymenopellis radicata]
MTYPNQGYSRSNSISSASNLQSTPSPLSSYDAVRAASTYAPTPSVSSQGGPQTPVVPSSFDNQSCYPYDYEEGEDLTLVYNNLSDVVADRLHAIEKGLQLLSNSQKKRIYLSPAFMEYNGAQKGGNVVLDDIRDYCLRKVKKGRSDLSAELRAVESARQEDMY